ncbi:MAG: ABC transporter permease [Qingshengfaniella sp.]
MSKATEMGVRRFGRVNWLGLVTLASREIRRFLRVWTQTIAAPLVTAALFLAIFSLAIGPSRGAVMGVPFIQFLAPGILMMTVVQSAFANTSSAILIAKIQGNIVDTLMPPLNAGELLAGYLVGSVGRGLLVGVAVLAMMALVLGQVPAHPLWVLVFLLLGCLFLGGLGIFAGILANKFEQMAMITNFVVTPLSFLSGTFYSVEHLPPVMRMITHFNPVFYLIDGVRYGVVGQSDSTPWLGLLVCGLFTAAVLLVCWGMLRRGYRLKA